MASEDIANCLTIHAQLWLMINFCNELLRDVVAQDDFVAEAV
jgi:hypothetical protein